MEQSIRELSRNASAVIRRVNGGETVQVTSHGAVAAVIMPVSQRERAHAALSLLDHPPGQVSRQLRGGAAGSQLGRRTAQ